MPLTWRNVTAPDFTPSMRGYETFSRLLGDAFGGFQRGLNQYDQSISDDVNTQLQLRIAAAQDSDAAKDILANLGSDPNSGRISAQTLELGMNRPDALINTAINEGRLDDSVYNRNRVRGFDSAEDRFAALYPERAAAYARGTEEGRAWDTANPDAMQGLSLAATRQNVLDGSASTMTGLEIEGAGLRNEGQVISNDRGRIGNRQAEFDYDAGVWRFGNEQVDRKDVESAQGFIANLQNRGYTLEDLNGLLSSSDLTPGAQAIVRAQTGTSGIAPSYGGSGGGSGGSSGGVNGDPLRVMNYEARAAGVNSVPSNIQTLGQLSQWQRGLNNDGIRSSAFGVYQIVGQTLRGYAPRVLGADWENAPLTLENQDRIAEAIFNDHRGSASQLRGQWVSLSTAEAERIRRLPWEQAREVIARGESSSSPAALMLAQTVSGQSGRQQYQQTNSASGIVTSIQPYMADTSPLSTVVSRLTSEGPLSGASVQFVTGQINRIKQQAATGRNPVRLTDAAAGEILINSLGANDNWFPNFFNPGDPSANNDWKVDPQLLESNIDQIRIGGPDNTLVANQSMEILSNQVSSARQAWESANTRLTNARAEASRNPNFDQRIIGRLMIEEEQARGAWQNAIEMQQSAAVSTGAAPLPQSSPPPARGRGPVAENRPVQPDGFQPGWFGRGEGRPADRNATRPRTQPARQTPRRQLLPSQASEEYMRQLFPQIR